MVIRDELSIKQALVGKTLPQKKTKGNPTQMTSKQQHSYVLDYPQIDWLTLTSFEPLAYETQLVMMAKVKQEYGRAVKEHEGTKRLQYLGTAYDTPDGTLFRGVAEQRGQDHFMTQISGELCNNTDLLIPIAAGIREGWLKCRRIDIQATVLEPASHNQWALFNRGKLLKKRMGWVESVDKSGNSLATVYDGNRDNEKFLRVYEKMAGETRLLRAEYEIKGNTAQSVANMIFRDGHTVAQLFKHFIQKTDDKELSLLYLPMLETITAVSKINRIKTTSNTEKWLRETVYPAFLRYVNEQTSDEDLIYMFQQAIDDAWGNAELEHRYFDKIHGNV